MQIRIIDLPSTTQDSWIFFHRCSHVKRNSWSEATCHLIIVTVSFAFKKMEGVKQLLTPTRFSVFGYTITVLFASTGIAFIGITSKLRMSERRKFLCEKTDGLSDKNFYQAQCFEKYERQYNTPLPLYGSILLSFSVVLIVCFIYSWCCVKSWICLLYTSDAADEEDV